MKSSYLLIDLFEIAPFVFRDVDPMSLVGMCGGSC